MSHDVATTDRSPRVLTGRTVLLCFVAFFGVVFAANAVLIRAAMSSFGGVETESSYKAGLAFKSEVAAAHAQAARHWEVDASLTPAAGGATAVTVTAKDEGGAPLAGLALTARLVHPTDARRDHALTVTETAPGVFEGVTSGVAGSWELILDLSRGDERLFRSKSRVLLR